MLCSGGFHEYGLVGILIAAHALTDIDIAVLAAVRAGP